VVACPAKHRLISLNILAVCSHDGEIAARDRNERIVLQYFVSQSLQQQ
jgi:hypothetical protein